MKAIWRGTTSSPTTIGEQETTEREVDPGECVGSERRDRDGDHRCRDRHHDTVDERLDESLARDDALVVARSSIGSAANGLSSAVHHPVVVISAGLRTDVTSRPSVGIDHNAQITTTAIRNGALRMNAGRQPVATLACSVVCAGAVMRRLPGGAGSGR